VPQLVDLQKVRESLSITCTACQAKLDHGPDLRRIDGRRYRCPKCGAAFEPESKNKGSSAIGFN